MSPQELFTPGNYVILFNGAYISVDELYQHFKQRLITETYVDGEHAMMGEDAHLQEYTDVTENDKS